MDISESLGQSFSDQYNKELVNHSAYLSLSEQADNLAWEGFSKFFNESAKEELEHANGIREFLIDRNYLPRIMAHPAQVTEAQDPKGWVEIAYAAEQANTKSLYALFGRAGDEDDYDACVFLHPYLMEQRKSERELFDLLTQIGRAGSNAALMLIDHDLLERKPSKLEWSPF